MTSASDLTLLRAVGVESEVEPAVVELRPGLNAFSFKQSLEAVQRSYTYQAVFQPLESVDERGEIVEGEGIGQALGHHRGREMFFLLHLGGRDGRDRAGRQLEVGITGRQTHRAGVDPVARRIAAANPLHPPGSRDHAQGLGLAAGAAERHPARALLGARPRRAGGSMRRER